MLDGLMNEKVVIDLSSPFVCLGRLVGFDANFLELKNADLHDLRDTDSSRENYVVDCLRTGIKRNRKRLFVKLSEVVAIAKLEDVADE